MHFIKIYDVSLNSSNDASPPLNALAFSIASMNSRLPEGLRGALRYLWRHQNADPRLRLLLQCCVSPAAFGEKEPVEPQGWKTYYGYLS